MLKKFFYTFLLVFIICAGLLFTNPPAKIARKLLPVFLKGKYGISTGIKEIKGSFEEGIYLSGIRLKKGRTRIECEEITMDLKMGDLLFPDKKKQYNINIKGPKISVGGAQTKLGGFLAVPGYPNVNIDITNAELNIEALGKDTTLKFNGRIIVKNNTVKFDEMGFLLEGLTLVVRGGIDKDKLLDLSAHFADSKNEFLIKGKVDNPTVYTYWNGLETLFSIGNIKYDNGRLALSGIKGSVNAKGFPPVDFSGGMGLDRDGVRFYDMTILKYARVNGIFSGSKPSRVKISMNNVDGGEIAKSLPAALRALIVSRKINLNADIFGMNDALQGGGVLSFVTALDVQRPVACYGDESAYNSSRNKILPRQAAEYFASEPFNVACRYRNKKFLFAAIQGNIFGSVNIADIPAIKIKGSFEKMDINRFADLLGKKTGNKCEGTIKGSFSINGELKAPDIGIKLEMENVEYGSVRFDAAYINLKGKGTGPLNLEHSMVYYKEIPGELTGFIDPREHDLFKNIEIKPTGEGFIWKGLNITKDDKNDAVKFGKDIGGNVSVSFKPGQTSDPGYREDNPEIELEYKLRDDKNLLIKMQEDEGTVGVEHKTKF